MESNPWHQAQAFSFIAVMQRLFPITLCSLELTAHLFQKPISTRVITFISPRIAFSYKESNFNQLLTVNEERIL